MKYIFIILILINFCRAADSSFFDSVDNNQDKKNDEIKKKKKSLLEFMHNINPSDAAYSGAILDRYKKIENETLSLSILNKPLTKRIKDINTIYIHPHYINNIYFPKYFEMKKTPLFSFKTHSQRTIITPNTISFKVPPNFVNGNIVVYGFDTKEEKNYFFTINVEKISYTKLLYDEYLKRYLVDGNYFSNMNKFYFHEDYDAYTILNNYLKINNITHEIDLSKIFKKNGSYDLIITPKNEILYIIRDKDNYDIEFRNVKFKITPEYSISKASKRVNYEK